MLRHNANFSSKVNLQRGPNTEEKGAANLRKPFTLLLFKIRFKQSACTHWSFNNKALTSAVMVLMVASFDGVNSCVFCSCSCSVISTRSGRSVRLWTIFLKKDKIGGLIVCIHHAAIPYADRCICRCTFFSTPKRAGLLYMYVLLNGNFSSGEPRNKSRSLMKMVGPLTL